MAIETTSSNELYRNVVECIEKEKIIFLLTGESLDNILEAAQFLKENGKNLIGIDSKVPKLKERLKSFKRKGERNFGVFSVATPTEARVAINSGAIFLFYTHFDKGISRKCKREKIFHGGGSLTPSEVYSTHEIRADAVSLFPCSKMGGVDWLLELKHMFPQVKYIPTDKMTPSEAGEYLKAGSYAVAPIISIDSKKKSEKTVNDYLNIYS